MDKQTPADAEEPRGGLSCPTGSSRQAPLSKHELRLENLAFSCTGGVSQHNRDWGFVPAYINLRTGQTAVSRFANGEPAPVHLLEGVPEEWVVARDDQGGVCRVLATIVAGFLRNGRFYTREAAARMLSVKGSA